MKNTIQYSSSPNSSFTEYVGIGGCEIDPQDPEAYLLPQDQSIEGWKEFLDVSEDINPIRALNYILLNDSPEDYFPEPLLDNFKKNRAEIEQIIHNWFEHDSSLFKFLDLINGYSDDEVKELIELNDQETKYIFKDDSTIIINELEVDRHQYFVPVSAFQALKTDLLKLKHLIIGDY